MEINDQSRNIEQFHVAEQLRLVDRMNRVNSFQFSVVSVTSCSIRLSNPQVTDLVVAAEGIVEQLSQLFSAALNRQWRSGPLVRIQRG